MNETPQELQDLHEVLKASKAAKYFVKIHWPEYAYRLSVESPKATESNQLTIHIEVDEQHPGRFTYHALSNKPFSNKEAFRSIEKKENATAQEVIEVVYKLLEPGSKWL